MDKSSSKAYISAVKVSNDGFGVWVAQVVSEQDYFERGPHAHSHQTKRYPDAQAAKAAATEWAEAHGYKIYSADDLAGGCG